MDVVMLLPDKGRRSSVYAVSSVQKIDIVPSYDTALLNRNG